MKRCIVTFLIIVIVFPYISAQSWKLKRYEGTFGLGTTHFLSDIGGYPRGSNAAGLRDIRFRQTRFDFNVNLKYKIARSLNARLGLAYGLLNGNDAAGSNASRGYVTNVTALEPLFIMEYYFIKNKLENSYLFAGGDKRSFSDFLKTLDVYAFTGVGGIFYTVSGNDLLEEQMDLEGTKDRGSATIIPVGIGVSIPFSPDFNFGIELGGRFALSDYVDGYAPASSSANDFYYFFNFTLTYKFNTGTNGLPSFR